MTTDASATPSADAPFGPPLWLVVLSAAIPVSLIAAWVVAKETKMAKRKRGLSGTPEHHASEMSVARRGAIRYFKSAGAAAERGTCSTAFSQLAAAFALDGVADAHGSEARYPSDHNLSDKVKASTAAQAAFRSNCMKGGANLSGLRRRKARR